MFTVFDAYTDKPMYSINAPDSERSNYASGETYVSDYVEIIPDDLHINQVKANAKSLINGLTGDKILSLYPDHKQRNMTARYMKLMKLNQLETTEALNLESIWTWIESVRAASNIANAALLIAGDNDEINLILADYTAQLSQL